MSENYFDVPEQQLEGARSTKVTNRIDLPYPHLKLWWKNGVIQAPNDNTVRFHGGWAVNTGDAENTLAAMRKSELPSYFTEPMDFVNRKNETFSIYTARFVPVALIARRKAWFTSQQKGSKYSRVNFLVYLAEIDTKNKVYVPWGPATLQASGFSGMHIEKAFQRWEAITASARHEFANALPAWVFYALLGTVDSERQIVEVGSGSNVSPITPCKVREPEAMGLDDLKKWFIGKEVLAETNELRELADDWLHAWDDVGKDNGQASKPTDVEVPGFDDTEDDTDDLADFI